MNRKTKRILKTICSKTVAIALLSLGAVVMLFPFLWSVSASLQGPGSAFAYPPVFFKPPFFWSNYQTALGELNFLQYFINTVFLTTVACIAHPLSCAYAAFGLSRYDSPTVRVLTAIVIALIVIPVGGNMVPTYRMWMSLNMLDTYVPLLTPYFLGTTFGVYLIRQNFKALPGDYYEAALIDGCNPIYIFIKIYLPLAKSILAVTVLNTFMVEWNEMMNCLIYITSKSKYNLAIGLLYAKGNYIYRQEVLMASAVIMMVPSIIIYAILQKYFVEGLATAGVKG